MGAKNSRKGRKIGRDKVKCARYKAAGTREKNKERKRLRHERQVSTRKPR